MASSRGIRAGRAFVELFADDSKLVRGLRGAEKRLKAFGAKIRNLGLRVAGLGAAMLAPLAASAKAFGAMGDQVAKMAKRTGFGVEALSELQYVASQSGTSLEAMETGFRRMQRSIYDAGRGLSTQTDALADLGLQYKDLAGLAPEKQFKMLADAISRIEDPTRKAALAQALFGRAGTQLLPMMADGAKGIEALQEKARQLGLTMSGEDARSAEVFTDALDSLVTVLKMGVFNIGAALAPVLSQLAGTITDVAKRVSAWVAENRQLVVVVAKVAAGVAIAGTVLAVLGVIVSAVGSVFGVLATILGVVLSPMGLVIAAAVALGAALFHAGDNGGKAMEWLGKAFGWFKGAAKTALSAVGFAIKNWRAVLEYAVAAGVLNLVRFASQTKHFLVVAIPGYLKWFSENWRDVFQTVWNYTKTVTTNIGKNLKNLWKAIVGFAKGDGWNFEWTPLTKGFESTIKELPKIAEREIGELERSLSRRVEKLGSQLQSDWNEHDAEFQAELGKSGLGGMKELAQSLGLVMSGEDAAAGGEMPDIEFKVPDMPDLSALADAAKAGGSQLSDQASKIGTAGTFNAAAITGLQAGQAVDRMATGIDKIERNTRPMRDATGLAFE